MAEQDQLFSIAVRKFGPFETAMQLFWEKYCAFSGCTLKLEMVVMDLHELYEETLTHGGLANGKFDIAHINTDWIYEGYQTQAFEKLNDRIAENPPLDFPDGWSKSLLALQQFNGDIVGLPFHDGPECLIYRKDLLENEIEKANFLSLYNKPLTVPKTWEDFYQVSRFFNRPKEGLYGSIFACYPDGHNAVFDFCLQLWTRGGSLMDEKGKVQLSSSAALEALDFYRKIVNDESTVHPKSGEFDSVAAGIAFSQGEAAMMINWFGFAAICEVDPNSKVKGKIDVDILPSTINSASLNVYWLYTIANGSKNKQVAYDFLRFVLMPENDKLLTLEGGIGCRISTWKDEEINKIIPYYHKLEALHEVANMLPQKKNWAEMVKVIDQMVNDAVHSTEPSETLITKAQHEINLLEE